jgi:hypothetical protein
MGIKFNDHKLKCKGRSRNCMASLTISIPKSENISRQSALVEMNSALEGDGHHNGQSNCRKPASSST